MKQDNYNNIYSNKGYMNGASFSEYLIVLYFPFLR